MFDFLQSGGDGLPCGDEYDVFLAPTDSAYDNADFVNLNTSPGLDVLQDLTVVFELALLQASSTPRCGAVGLSLLLAPCISAGSGLMAGLCDGV